MQPNSAHVIQSFRGGISDENNKGIAGAFKFGYGLSTRERDDVLKCGFALVKESGVTVTELINFIVPCTDGNSYHFGDKGGIYKRTSAGVWSKVYTGASGAIVGADEWNGYFYWATASALNEMIISGNWTTDVNSIATWPKTLTTATWHTMLKATGNLIICNANKLALVDFAGVFNASALELIPGNLSKCLEEDSDSVLAGTIRSDNDEQGHLFSWQTAALSWIQKKKIATKGINAFITSELMLMQCGIDGEVYYSDMVTRVPAFIFPDGGYCLPGGTCGRKGLALFGVHGNGSTKCGVYSYGRNRKNFNYTLSLDYILSPGLLTGIIIGAIQTINGTLLTAWQTGGTATVTIADPCVVTWANHGQVTGTPIMFTTTGALPTGITASTYYYLRVIDANTFNLYDTAAHAIAGGATGRVATSGTQSGTHTAANYGVDALSTTVRASGDYESLEWDGGKALCNRIKSFLQTKIEMDALPSGCSIALNYKMDRASSWTAAKTIDGNASFSTTGKTTAIFNINARGKKIELQILLTPSGSSTPVIQSLTTFFNMNSKALI